jgi:hypothetical protein
MLNKKLIHYLKNLKKREFSLLENYLKYAKQKEAEQALILLEYLEAFHPNFDNEKDLEVSLIAKVLNDKIEDSCVTKIREIARHLCKKVEAWLVTDYITASENSALQEYLLAQTLKERQDYEFYLLVSKQITTNINKFKNIIIDDEYLLSNIHFQHYIHPQANRKSVKNEDLQLAETHLDYFYLIQKLKIGIEKYYERPLLLQINEVNISDEWYEILKRAEALQKNHYLLEMYYFLSCIYQKGESQENKLNQLYQKYNENIDKLSDFDLRYFCNALISFMNINILNSNNKPNYQKLLKLYSDGLEKGFLIPYKQISFTTFRNISIVLGKNQDRGYYRKFIEKYSPMLNESELQNAILLADAYYACYARDFNLCLVKIINYSIYSLEIISTFELFAIQSNSDDLSEQLTKKINAFEMYIYRDKAPKEPFRNFLLAVKSLEKFDFHSFLTLMNTDSPIVQREWLNDFYTRIK